jgi:hypothetical protein
MSHLKIIARLKASQEKYKTLKAQCALLEAQCILLEDATEEYTAAWASAGEIWETAQTAEDNGMLGKAKKLWALLAPFDDEAATRLEELL